MNTKSNDEKTPKKSVLHDLVSKFDENTSVEVIKATVPEYLKTLTPEQIREKDRKDILRNIAQCDTTYKCLKYLYNSLLFFEGHGVVKSLPR